MQAPIVFGINRHTHMHVVGQLGEPRGQHGASGLAHARDFVKTTGRGVYVCVFVGARACVIDVKM